MVLVEKGYLMNVVLYRTGVDNSDRNLSFGYLYRFLSGTQDLSSKYLKWKLLIAIIYFIYYMTLVHAKKSRYIEPIAFFSLLGPKLESVNKVETTEKVSPFSLFLINALVQMNLTAKVNSSQKQVSNL